MFPQMVDNCAHADQVAVSLSGRMRKATTSTSFVVRNVAIGGSKSLYARAVDAQSVILRMQRKSSMAREAG